MRELNLAVSYPRQQRSGRLFVQRCDDLGTVSVSRVQFDGVFVLAAL